MQRRQFLQAAGIVAAYGIVRDRFALPVWHEESYLAPTRSIEPVVGDGTWIWNEPPTDLRGYLEPRPFRLKTGIEIEGTGGAGELQIGRAHV